ncbi:hypothetical protein SJAV_25850 [Sulfurisphaera javensis]|uniref:Transcriptional regulator n=1 Tax=Sulfurisphaera javensis TaxID=2049879 RepID=A0AAT9GVA7_9CREN
MRKYFSEEELCILDKLAYSSLSLYKLKDCVKLPLTTLWRYINLFIDKGYIIHAKRGSYVLTPLGALVLYLSENDKYTKSALSYFSSIFGENAKDFIDTLIKISQKYKICILEVIREDLTNFMPYLVYELLTGEKLPAIVTEFIINKAKNLPFISSEGCKVLVIQTANGKRILVGRCKIKGSVSNDYCEHIEKMYKKIKLPLLLLYFFFKIKIFYSNTYFLA